MTTDHTFPPDLIGSKEACLILDKNRSTLVRWVRDGVLTPVHKLEGDNGAYLFARADVEALVVARDQQAAS
jgi:predicted site-specific integrase-resolvase